jgi:hypothetical protein
VSADDQKSTEPGQGRKSRRARLGRDLVELLPIHAFMIDLFPRGRLPVVLASIRDEERGTLAVDTVPQVVFSIGVTS